MLSNEGGYPVVVACDLLELPSSTFYYRPVHIDESELEAAIEDIAGQFPTYGTRRKTHHLRRSPYELKVNRKRVRLSAVRNTEDYLFVGLLPLDHGEVEVLRNGFATPKTT